MYYQFKLLKTARWLLIALNIFSPLVAAADCSHPFQGKIEWVGCDFSGRDFSGKTIDGNEIDNVNLTCANLNNTTLKFNYITSSNFSGASMRGAKILFTEMEEVQFDQADMQNSVIKGYRYKFVSFDSANLQGSAINVDREGDVSYKNADLKGAKFDIFVCGAGSIGRCNAITQFNLNYKANNTWPKKEIAQLKTCDDPNGESSEYRVMESVDLDGDGHCDSRVQVLGNHGSYPNQYFFINYHLPHGDEVLGIKYYQAPSGKSLLIEMRYADGKRMLYRLIDGVYQTVRIDYFRPDTNVNTFIYDRSFYPIKKISAGDKKSDSLLRK